MRQPKQTIKDLIGAVASGGLLGLIINGGCYWLPGEVLKNWTLGWGVNLAVLLLFSWIIGTVLVKYKDHEDFFSFGEVLVWIMLMFVPAILIFWHGRILLTITQILAVHFGIGLVGLAFGVRWQLIGLHRGKQKATGSVLS